MNALALNIDRLQEAHQHLETAQIKKKPNNRRLYLKRSVASVQTFLALNPMLSGWESATVLGNLALSISAGIEDDETIPAEDVREYQDALLDFNERYQDYLIDQDDLEQGVQDREVQQITVKASVNRVLKDSVPSLGLKALALVAGDINSLITDEPENDERVAQASLQKLKGSRTALNRSVDDEEYNLLLRQLDNIEPYLQKMRNELPRGFEEKVVVLKQPVLVVGTPRYAPTSKAQNYVSRYGIEMGGYWVLKNQIVLGVTTNLEKVGKNVKFRKAIADRLRDIYQADLEKRLKKSGISESQKNALRRDMENKLRDDILEEIENATKDVDMGQLVKLLSKRFGFELAKMEGSSRIKGSPYIYYWLVSNDIYQGVLNGLYSDISQWSLPYKG